MKTIIFCVVFVFIIIFCVVIPNFTTPKNLGVVDGKLASLPSSPNAVSSQTSDVDKFVEPLALLGSLSDNQDRIVSILENMGCVIITKSATYIHALHVSQTLQFRDDIEFFFDEQNMLIHFRSASRVGYSDLGVNQNRYQSIADQYQAN